MKTKKLILSIIVLFLTDSVFSVDEEYKRAVYIAEYHSLLRQNKSKEALSFAENYFPKHLSDNIKKFGHRNISERDFNPPKFQADYISTVNSDYEPKIQNLAGSEYNNHAQSMKSTISEYNKLLAERKFQEATTLAEKHFPKSENDYIKKNGHSPIKELIIQEEVVQEKKPEYKKVTKVFENETNLLYTLTYEDSTQIQTTWNHPFFIIGRGWTEVKNIKIGDFSKTASGKLQITNITVKELDKPIKVYNMEVEDHHTYYVSDAGVLVHNYDLYDQALITINGLTENQKQIRMHENLQNIYEEANEMEINGANPKKVKEILEKKLRKEVEEDLPYQEYDRLTDEEKAELKKSNISSQKEYDIHVQNIAEARVQTLLKTFDLPVAGRDFFGGKIVKAKGGIAGLPNVTDRVNTAISDLDNKLVKQKFGDRLETFRKEFPQNGSMDFKNVLLKDKSTGYTTYVNYNGKIVQSSDLGNMTFGYMLNKHFSGTPLSTNIVNRSISQGDSLNDWKRPDPEDDVKATTYGFRCSKSGNLIPSNSSSSCR